MALSDTRTFTDGAARKADLLYVLSRDNKLDASDVEHTSAIGWYKGKWGDVKNTNWRSTAVAVAKLPEERLVFVGESGEVCVYSGGKAEREEIKPRPRLIRRAREIGGIVYACGMLRQVFMRKDKDNWNDISAKKPAREEKVGFEDICGFGEKEIYAVGWGGEVWEFDGKSWKGRGCLTNMILASATCAEDEVYVVGQQGVILRGRHDSWSILDVGKDLSVDIWDVCYFMDKVYFSTFTGIFFLEEGELHPVDFGFDVSSCYRLTQADGVLWSIGPSDVLSFDGNRWSKIA